MMRMYGVQRKLVTGVKAFYKMEMHVLKVTELWVRASSYMEKCDRMCVSAWLLNFCMDGVVIKLNPRIVNEQLKVRLQV